MAETLHLKVVTPKGCVLDTPVESCTATATQGEICVLPGHCLLLTSLAAGRMIVKLEEGKETFAVDQGFLEAAPNRVNVITDHCISADDIDVDHTLIEISELEKELENKDTASPEVQPTIRRLDWARARLRSAK